MKTYTTDEFVAAATLDTGFHWMEADGEDVTVTIPAGTPWRRYGLCGVGSGSIRVCGEGNGDAGRGGEGNGDAIRSGKGNGYAWRAGPGVGDARRTGVGNGDAWKDGEGVGDAWRTGEGSGNALKHGVADGSAWRSGKGSGDAWKHDDGDGSAWRTGKGSGDAWNVIARWGDRALYGNGKGMWRAGCHGPFTTEQALAHWAHHPTEQDKADIYCAAIRKWMDGQK